MIEAPRQSQALLLYHRCEHWADKAKSMTNLDQEARYVNHTAECSQSRLEKCAITEYGPCTGDFTLQ